jgi:hypothetical protein
MVRMTPKKTAEATQMKLLLCDSKPMTLPRDKQQELAAALADLLLTGASELAEPDAGGQP